MNILRNFFLFKKKTEKINELNHREVGHYKEIAKLVKEARINKNLTIQELSDITRIPIQTINSIENNLDNKPKYPFIRSILFKLEECLGFKKNTLVKLAIREGEFFKRDEKNYLVRKFDLINTWQGVFLYFLILVLTIFLLKRYFILDVNFIEIQNIENKIIDK